MTAQMTNLIERLENKVDGKYPRNYSKKTKRWKMKEKRKVEDESRKSDI